MSRHNFTDMPGNPAAPFASFQTGRKTCGCRWMYMKERRELQYINKGFGIVKTGVVELLGEDRHAVFIIPGICCARMGEPLRSKTKRGEEYEADSFISACGCSLLYLMS